MNKALDFPADFIAIPKGIFAWTSLYFILYVLVFRVSTDSYRSQWE
jgi:hypothetical protein